MMNSTENKIGLLGLMAIMAAMLVGREAYGQGTMHMKAMVDTTELRMGLQVPETDPNWHRQIDMRMENFGTAQEPEYNAKIYHDCPIAEYFFYWPEPIFNFVMRLTPTGCGQNTYFYKPLSFNPTFENSKGCIFIGSKPYKSPSQGPDTVDQEDLQNYGKVGIGYDSLVPLVHRLNVNGDIQANSDIITDGILRFKVQDSSYVLNNVGGYASLYARREGTGGGVYIKDDIAQNGTRLNSHGDPRDVDQTANTSFSDPEVTLPFSFQHENSVLGKGAVVDMAKMVKYIETKMKSELGAKAGQLVFEYTLPNNNRLSLQQYQAAALETQVNIVEDEIKKLPWVKATLGTNGEIPTEATEEVDEVKPVVKEVERTKFRLDMTQMKRVAYTTKEKLVFREKTGRKVRALRSNWRLGEDGELYRKPTVNDVDLDRLVKNRPQLPQWVQDRLSQGAQFSENLEDSIRKIKEILQANAREGKTLEKAEASKP